MRFIIFIFLLMSPHISTTAQQLEYDLPTRAALQELKETATPSFPTDLNDYYPSVPDNQNAATHYLAAYDLLQPFSRTKYSTSIPLFDPNDATIFHACDRLPTHTAAASEKFLLDNQSAINQLITASKQHDSRYPLTFTTDDAPDLSHHIKIRTLAKLIELRAIIAAHHLRNNEFFENILLYLHLTQSLSNEPTITAHNLQLNLYENLFNQIERATVYQRLTAEQLQTLQNKLEDISLLYTYRRALIGERALMLVITKHDPYQYIGSLEQRSAIKTNLGTYLDIMQQLIDAPEYPAVNASDSVNLVINLPDKLALIREIFIDFTNSLQQTRDLYTRQQLTITALAIEQYRLIQHGQFPPTLNSLIPTHLLQIPRDPYLPARPLKYRYDESGAVVYSIGFDLIDNHGRERTPLGDRLLGHPPLTITNTSPDNPDLTDITISFLDYQKTHFPVQPPSHPNTPALQEPTDESSVLDELMMDF
ncbi:hypothetical protein KS4_21590 [Poriferisphaera corsica]|uniref:Uncharacterized protein n=1 Tax=Poriferisphaera corsica TaxID=2528020 RepID=A0A517YV46_9BACT|nr:hypothetical protein [Poriferisphaera corsica]QDU34097.1 hypothetical protein KS4_21590 [Poriferisphaera corsica]